MFAFELSLPHDARPGTDTAQARQSRRAPIGGVERGP